MFKNFDGNGSYITINNENANPNKRVEITGIPLGETWACLELRDCKYVDLRGDNDPDLHYGIKVLWVPDAAAKTVWVRQKCDHIKLGYIEMASGGLMVHDNTLSKDWIFDTVEIHHNYIHDVSYAGMYLGQNLPWIEDTPYIANFSVHDNLLERMGCYGMTVKGVHKTSRTIKIYNNTIRVTGVACSTDPVGAASYRAGIGTQYYLGDVYAEVYGNRIEHAAAQGINVKHGAHKVYDNLILGCGNDTTEKLEHGITTYSVNGGEIYDNIIIQPKGYGIYTLGACSNVKLSRNLIGDAGNGIGWAEREPNDIVLGTGADANWYESDVANFGFKAWSNDGNYENDDFSFPTQQAKGEISNVDYPASVNHSDDFDINVVMRNIGELPGIFKTQIMVNGTILVTSPEFILVGGEISHSMINQFIAPPSGDSMNIDVKCIRIT